MSEKRVRVLVADDSFSARELIAHIIDSEPDFEIVGQAEDGEMAVEMALKLRPDVIIMDLVMPKLNGFEATKRILKEISTRIVVVSGVFNKEEARRAFEAMDAGAMTVIEKPKWVTDQQYFDVNRFWVEAIKALAGVKDSAYIKSKIQDYMEAPLSKEKVEIIGIGASLGGPPFLSYLFSKLPSDFHIPIVVHQYIPSGLTNSLAEWLNAATRLTVVIAKEGELVTPGHIYLPKENHFLTVSDKGMISLQKIASRMTLPIDTLFQSIAASYGSKGAVVLLKGIGSDGNKGVDGVNKQHGLALVEEASIHHVSGVPSPDVPAGNVVQFDHIVNILCKLNAV